ncbi:hypothetical protein CsSME_00013150 [Camellia sinensis var. sinensis]
MAMASSLTSKSPHIHLHHRNPISLHSPSILSFPSHRSHFRYCALKTRSSAAGPDPYTASDLLRKPVISPGVEESTAEVSSRVSDEDDDDDEDDDNRSGGEGWVDWEDQILEDTVPLVGFVRMLLHSGKYESGDRLSPEHEKTILERLLPYHPECEKKIGCGVDYITVGYHPDFESSRCLFIVRKDGELVDFSYWKCIKGLIRKNYPLYADSFILRHFRRRRRSD